MIEIIHVSDLHFGKSKTWTDRAQGLLKKIQVRYPFGKNKNIHLLITGDIIHNSIAPKPPWRSEYRLAVKALAAFSPRVHVVPGNHDYGSGGIRFSKRCANYFDDHFLPALRIRRRFQPKRLFVKTLDDGKGSRILLIGLNSCLMEHKLLNISKGGIEKRQLESLKNVLKDPRYRRIPKIVCLHHIPHRRAKGLGMSLTDHEDLMKRVEKRVKALAFGHEGGMEAAEKRGAPPDSREDRPMMVRWAGHRGIKYYLDANACVKERSCYHIKVEKKVVTAQLVKLVGHERAKGG